ncbi:MAG TPA: tetratricopeptide repeat protein [Elusimicrobiota bacterium]|nr:tetratricopeptide repeat protein [Elusimicrobiota bacterium]
MDSNVKIPPSPWAQYRRQELVEQDFSGKDLSKANFSNCNLTKSNFQNATLIDVSFNSAQLQGADFSGAVLYRSSFKNSLFKNTRLDGASLAGAKFEGVSLEDCSLKGAKLQGNEMEFIKSEGSDWSSADLTGVNMMGGTFHQCNFTQGTGRGANLSGCYFKDCQLGGMDLRAANLQGAHLKNVQLDGALVQGARFWSVRGLTKDQRLYVERGGGSLYSPMALTGRKVMGFIGQHKSVQLALFLLVAFLTFQTVRYVQNPIHMTNRRLERKLQKANEKQDTKKAVVYLEILSRRFPHNESQMVNWSINLARAYMDLGQSDKALALSADLQKKVQSDGSLYQMQMFQGELQQRLNRYDQAKEAYAQALRYAQSEWDQLNIDQKIVDVYRSQGQVDEALRYYGSKLKQYGRDPQIQAKIYIDMGHMYRDQGRSQEALAHYSKGIPNEPEEWRRFDAQRSVFHINTQKGNPQALKNYEGLISVYQNNRQIVASIHSDLGGYWQSHENAAEAQKHFRMAAKFAEDPWTRYNAYRGEIDLLVASGDRTAALKKYEKLLSKFDANPGILCDIHVNIANMCRGEDQPEKAEKHYKKAMAIKCDPGRTFNALRGLADLYRNQNRISEAEKEYKEAIEVYRDFPDYVAESYQALAQILIDSGKGDNEKVLRLFEKAESMTRDPWMKFNAQRSQLEVKWRGGKRQDVLDSGQKLLAHYKSSPLISAHLSTTLGNYYREIGRQKEASALYGQAEKIFGSANDPWGQFNALRSRLEMGDGKTALSGFKQAVEAYKKYPHIMHAIYIQLGRLSRDPEEVNRYFQESHRYAQDPQQHYQGFCGEAEFLRQNGNQDQALLLFEKLLARFSKNRDISFDLHLKIAQLCLDQSRYEKVSAHYAAASALALNDGEKESIDRGLAELFERSGKTEQAIGKYMELIAKSNNGPYQSDLHRRIARVYQGMSRWAEALDHLKKSSALSTDRGQILDARRRQIDVLMQMGKAPDALEQAESLHKDYASEDVFAFDVNIVLGDVLRNTGQPAKALPYYQAALKVAQEGGQRFYAQREISQVFMQMNEPAKLEELWRSVLQEHKKNPDMLCEVYSWAGALARDTNKYGEAETYFKESLARANNKWQKYGAQVDLLELLRRKGKQAEALQKLKDLRKSYEDSQGILYEITVRMAQISQDMNDIDGASAHYNAAAGLTQDPWQLYNVQRGLAELKQRAGKPEEAIPMLLKSMEVFKDQSGIVSEIKQRIGQLYKDMGKQEEAKKYLIN